MVTDASSLTVLGNLETLQLGSNQILQVPNVTSMTKLIRLKLDNNQIEDVEPMLNMGLTKRHAIDLKVNPLNSASTSSHIPRLQRNGVSINWSLAPSAATIAKLLDVNLEAAIREAVGIPEGIIFVSSLESLISLDLSSKGISSLKGIEACTNLVTLSLSANNVTSISPLAPLTALTSLSLDRNQITDIAPLASLRQLRTLSLADNQVKVLITSHRSLATNRPFPPEQPDSGCQSAGISEPTDNSGSLEQPGEERGPTEYPGKPCENQPQPESS